MEVQKTPPLVQHGQVHGNLPLVTYLLLLHAELHVYYWKLSFG